MAKKARELKDYEIAYVKANYANNSIESLRAGLFKLNKERGIEFTMSSGSLRLKITEELGLTKGNTKNGNPNFTKGAYS